MPRMDLWQVPLLVMATIIVVVLAVPRKRISTVVLGWLRTAGLAAVCLAGLLLLVVNWGVNLGINVAQLAIEGGALYFAVQSYQATREAFGQQPSADAQPVPPEPVQPGDASTPSG